ncbi:hypothetical protein L9F63_011365 [Diploptera punctata]|uniref:Uncharacterized protein n=1 Tax=Diploptera punctata TaxID=6984 RepID=A0AAD8AEW9_DIPPU|nr:hypothetical protein L9F63_011365 [Diploptera punctata]
MGKTSDEEGETSAKTCRTDDANDRPLKKARYVWQIKGKYHLKKPENEEGAKLFIADETKDGYTLHPIEMSHSDIGPQNQESETAGNSSNVEESKQELSSAISPPVSEQQSPLGSDVLNPLQLQKWQARQVARCFVDNTINRVLEDMGFIPLPVDADDLMEDFTMSSSRRNDANLEDAAVMMAIHSHGLQRAAAGLRSSSQESKTESVTEKCACRFSLDSVNFQSNLNEDSMDVMKGWDTADHQSNKTSRKQPDLFVDGFMQEGLSLASEWMQTNDSNNDDRDDENEEIIQNNQNIFNSNFESEQKDGQFEADMEDRSSSFEHTDFLDRAVAVAIQKKGLSTLSGVDYG